MKPTRLPRSIDDLRGLRAARWIRESTAGQVDRFGPDAQREQQDRAIERYGLQDTGREWVVAHSGRTVATTGSFGEMLAGAGAEWDVLVVGYVSRFARDLRTAVNARHDLHAAGAAILFADERVLSSDEDAWETWAREAVEAEAYSRRLGKRIREGYAAKYRREADQGGNAPLGFRRSGPAHTLEVDPETIGRVVALYRRYATGTLSVRQLADESGLMIGHLVELLKNPIYNGWVRRGQQRTVLTGADCAAILSATATWRYHAAVAVSIGTGIRRGELLGLVWGDVERDRIIVRQRLRRDGGEYVIVEGTKASERPLPVPLPAFARAALDAWRLVQDAERIAAGDNVEPLDGSVPVFTTPKGQHVHGSLLTHQFQDILEAAKLPRIAWHDMRHATADMLAAAGVDQSTARDYLRHASVVTTQDHYTGTAWASLVGASLVIQRAVGE